MTTTTDHTTPTTLRARFSTDNGRPTEAIVHIEEVSESDITADDPTVAEFASWVYPAPHPERPKSGDIYFNILDLEEQGYELVPGAEFTADEAGNFLEAWSVEVRSI
jgi:hypothetical protein